MNTKQPTTQRKSTPYRVTGDDFPATLEALRSHWERSGGSFVSKGGAIARAVSEALRRVEKKTARQGS